MNIFDMLFVTGFMWFGIGIAHGDVRLIGMSLALFGILILVGLVKYAKKGKNTNGDDDITIVLPRIED